MTTQLIDRQRFFNFHYGYVLIMFVYGGEREQESERVKKRVCAKDNEIGRERACVCVSARGNVRVFMRENEKERG